MVFSLVLVIKSGNGNSWTVENTSLWMTVAVMQNHGVDVISVSVFIHTETCCVNLSPDLWLDITRSFCYMSSSELALIDMCLMMSWTSIVSSLFVVNSARFHAFFRITAALI